MREFANHKIGLRMTEFRLKTGLSQNQFAKKIGMSASHYSRLERGRQNISFLLLEEIAQKWEFGSMFLLKWRSRNRGLNSLTRRKGQKSPENSQILTKCNLSTVAFLLFYVKI